jgi:hypothetical protein
MNDEQLYRRDKIFNVVKVGYVAKKKKNLPIFGIKFKDLRDYTTNESDVGKGISRIPLQLARLYEEDVMEEIEVQSPASGSAGAGDQHSVLDNYNKVMEHR